MLLLMLLILSMPCWLFAFAADIIAISCHDAAAAMIRFRYAVDIFACFIMLPKDARRSPELTFAAIADLALILSLLPHR